MLDTTKPARPRSLFPDTPTEDAAEPATAEGLSPGHAC